MARKVREQRTAVSVRNEPDFTGVVRRFFLCLVKFKLKINYGRALNLLSGVVSCLDVNSETPTTSLSAKFDTAKDGFSLPTHVQLFNFLLHYEEESFNNRTRLKE